MNSKIKGWIENMRMKSEMWLEKIEMWERKINRETSSIFHNVEDDEDATAFFFSGLDGTVYVFPDGSVAVVDAEEDSYGDTVIRDSSLHTSLPALADWLTTRHTELIEQIQAVGDTHESADAFSQAEHDMNTGTVDQAPQVEAVETASDQATKARPAGA